MQTLRHVLADQAGFIELGALVVDLILAAFCAVILSKTYTRWGDSFSNRRRFADNFLMVTVATTFIIAVVKSSLALSLGLVGALSIIRFRTAIKEPEELAYLFMAIGLGVGFGADQPIISLLVAAFIVSLIWLRRTFRSDERNVNFHLTVGSRSDRTFSLEQIVDILRPNCSQLELARFDDNAEQFEASFLLEFKSFPSLNKARASLQQLSDSIEITFLSNRGIG
ncbi:MAG: DUF4956 domain-containing protein [Gemmatimonadetes bacterium]|nr:DUF4956 domain-containing protein [Gemmatimonadota bacterium]